ncbi:hypothetical protein SAMN05428970_2018 [Agromyces sp. CF514]|nr:hypothetical protein SAMN05428970_2018 [Agromyces sp. CF514]
MVALHLAALRLEADMGTHGIPMSEATDAAYAGQWITNDKPRVDYVKLKLNQEQERYYEAHPDVRKDRPAHIWYVKGREEG